MILLLSAFPLLPAERPHGIADLIHDARVKMESALRRRRTIKRLRALDDRCLADIGIARDEIEMIVGAIEAKVIARGRSGRVVPGSVAESAA